jgi:indole-3-glycerol phosphate synthase
MPLNQLDVISSHALLRALDRKAAANIPEMERKAAARSARGFAQALRDASTKGPAIIAELKKASPSKGLIRANYDPTSLAKSFEAGGATCLSVLTDEEFFQGSLADLIAVREVVNIPILRKDFIVDPFQILEAKAAGADAILLIVASHTDADLKELHEEANLWGLDVLCETHTVDEISRALDLGFGNIGVNSRDLKTMKVDTKRLYEMVSALPVEVLRIAESGIGSFDEVERLMKAGYDAFLIGEALMRQPEPAAQLAVLLDTEYASEF